MFAIYNEKKGGWLVDTCDAWSWDVENAAWFPGREACGEAIQGMIENGHTDIQMHECFFLRVN